MSPSFIALRLAIADKKYAERKVEAKSRGYKWGAYLLGKPGDPIKQADFFLATVKPEPDDLMALDLESTDFEKHMSFAEARVFINRIKEKPNATRSFTQTISS